MLRTPTASTRVVSLGLAAVLLAGSCGKDEVLKLDEAIQEPDEEVDNTPPRPSANPPGDGFADGDLGDDTDGLGNPNPTQSPPRASGVIGKACATDGDCGSGATCMLSGSNDFLGGGPAHGYCTADCSDETFDCATVDGNSTCIEQEGGAFCMEACLIGTPAAGEVKCQDRLDVACDQLTNVSICRPMCRNDEDCDADRACDLANGVCVDEVPAGAAVGADCTVDPDCQSGVCLPIDDTRGFCSGNCSLATVVADDPVTCGSSSQDEATPGQPLCLLPAFQGSGFGDRGFCGTRCNCDDDCGFVGAVCESVLEDPQEALDLLGTVGICISGAAPEGEMAPPGIPCTVTPADAGAPDAG